MVAATIGVLTPITLSKLKFDPAVSSAVFVTATTEDELLALFNKHRTAEYDELLEGCDNFLREIEIENETRKGKFTFHEVEENEAELGKLKRWHKKIAKRDFFHNEKAEAAQVELETCEQYFNAFVETVYATEGRSEGEI